MAGYLGLDLRAQASGRRSHPTDARRPAPLSLRGRGAGTRRLRRLVEKAPLNRRFLVRGNGQKASFLAVTADFPHALVVFLVFFKKAKNRPGSTAVASATAEASRSAGRAFLRILRKNA